MSANIAHRRFVEGVFNKHDMNRHEGMRAEAIKFLEQYDYNLDKAISAARSSLEAYSHDGARIFKTTQRMNKILSELEVIKEQKDISSAF